MDPIQNFYVSCINCTNSSLNCPGINKDKTAGIIPKGFLYSTSNPKILIAAKNPGHPLNGEIDFYRNKNDMDIVDAHKKFARQAFTEKALMTAFHKNLNRYIRFFLDLGDSEEIDIFDFVSYTNVVKCETIKESSRISSVTMNNCFNNHFIREIDLFKPKVILALGREVEYFLKKQNLDVPVVGIKHPSYYYRKTDEREILTKIKQQLLPYIS